MRNTPTMNLPTNIDITPLRAAETALQDQLQLYYRNDRLTISPAVWSLIRDVPFFTFLAVFVVFGSVGCGGVLFVAQRGTLPPLERVLDTLMFLSMYLLIGLPLWFLICLIATLTARPLVIDKAKGVIRVGRKVRAEIARIRDIQVICGGIREDGELGTYKVYEINVVLSDSSRSNLFVVMSKEWGRQCGIEVAQWLGVPFHDQIDDTIPCDDADATNDTGIQPNLSS